MGAGDYNVTFADLAGVVIFQTITAAVPRVGDHVDLRAQRVAGVVDRVTWLVESSDRSSRAVVAVRPHTAG